MSNFARHPTFVALLLSLAPCVVHAQQSRPSENPFRASGAASDGEEERTPTHPDGENPHQRMLSLVHTDALPRFDRADLYAVSFPDPEGNERPKSKPTDKTFPVRPYGLHADVHGHATLEGEACDRLRDAWQSLAFDRLGGAFCHYPAYGIRLYRDNALLFETTICWQCQNFYVPSYDAEERRFTHGWYGFANDAAAKALLEFFRSQLPHPKIAGATN